MKCSYLSIILKVKDVLTEIIERKIYLNEFSYNDLTNID